MSSLDYARPAFRNDALINASGAGADQIKFPIRMPNASFDEAAAPLFGRSDVVSANRLFCRRRRPPRVK